ncbi:hypothetical protein L2088_02375 [Pseudomonas protegens]|uniref:hypothetical protein n=1 Tax=Pseudomonas protegens TaxID=380021 RepID=UPI00202589AC|nr:hypothetical protein [Pseudomonas protegens]MCL9653540.1 hypothetical protein [Pseudomonas protegens]
MSNEMISVQRDLAVDLLDGLRITQERARKELRALLAKPDQDAGKLPPIGRQAMWQAIDEALVGTVEPMLRGDICNILAAQLVPAEQPVLVTDQWPKLEKPAKVGAGRFSAGISTRLVVEAAQRHYEYEVTPEKETLRIAQGTTSLLQHWRHAVMPPSAAVLCLMAVAAKNACGEDATGIPLLVFVAAIKAALAERHSDHARALDAATSLDNGGPHVSDT